MEGQKVVNSRTLKVYRHLFRVLPKAPRGLFLVTKVGSISRSLDASDMIDLVAGIVRGVRARSPHAGLCVRDLLPVGRSFKQCGAVAKGASLVPRVGHGLRTLTGRGGVSFVRLFPLFARGGDGIVQGRLAASKLRLARRKCEV